MGAGVYGGQGGPGLLPRRPNAPFLVTAATHTRIRGGPPLCHGGLYFPPHTPLPPLPPELCPFLTLASPRACCFHGDLHFIILAPSTLPPQAPTLPHSARITSSLPWGAALHSPVLGHQALPSLSGQSRPLRPVCRSTDAPPAPLPGAGGGGGGAHRALRRPRLGSAPNSMQAALRAIRPCRAG